MGGFASLKVRGDDKRQFDRLLHEYAIKTGQSITQHELFHKILSEALAHKKAILAQRGRQKKQDWRKYQFDLGEDTDVDSDLDSVVYGI